MPDMRNNRLTDNYRLPYTYSNSEAPDPADATTIRPSADGPNSPNMAASYVESMVSRVVSSGVLGKLQTWQAEEQPHSTRGTRRHVSERAVLVGLLILADERTPMTTIALADLFHTRLPAEARTLLQLPETIGASAGRMSEAARWRSATHIAYHQLWTLPSAARTLTSLP
jgi:hypothetical protein